MTLPPEVTRALDEIAAKRGLSRRGAMILAVGFLQAAERARQDGLHIGAARDREALEVLITPRAPGRAEVSG